jgi:hypothetical protein
VRALKATGVPHRKPHPARTSRARHAPCSGGRLGSGEGANGDRQSGSLPPARLKLLRQDERVASRAALEAPPLRAAGCAGNGSRGRDTQPRRNRPDPRPPVSPPPATLNYGVVPPNLHGPKRDLLPRLDLVQVGSGGSSHVRQSSAPSYGRTANGKAFPHSKPCLGTS